MVACRCKLPLSVVAVKGFGKSCVTLGICGRFSGFGVYFVHDCSGITAHEAEKTRDCRHSAGRPRPVEENPRVDLAVVRTVPVSGRRARDGLAQDAMTRSSRASARTVPRRVLPQDVRPEGRQVHLPRACSAAAVRGQDGPRRDPRRALWSEPRGAPRTEEHQRNLRAFAALRVNPASFSPDLSRRAVVRRGRAPLGVTEGAIKSRVHRVRLTCREAAGWRGPRRPARQSTDVE